jgi:hypothetical protein
MSSAAVATLGKVMVDPAAPHGAQEKNEESPQTDELEAPLTEVPG